MIFGSKIAAVPDKATDVPRKKAKAKKTKGDQRKRKADRRSSVRDGVIVTLSYQSDRRKGTDRRSV